MTDNIDKPGHLARRFQQIAVAVFHAEVEEAGYDLTPVQYAALTTVGMQPGIDQATLAGLIAYDRTTITGVVDRLVQKGLLVRKASRMDRRAHALQITTEGRRTLDGIEPARPDVLVADLGLPTINGFDLIARIRRLPDRELRHIPAAALTAYARSEDRVKAFQSGFQMHLAKPIDPVELIAAIATLAGRNQR